MGNSHLWSKLIQLVLLKEVVNLKVDKLRTILIIKADYNWISKILVNKRLNPKAEKLVLIPEE